MGSSATIYTDFLLKETRSRSARHVRTWPFTSVAAARQRTAFASAIGANADRMTTPSSFLQTSHVIVDAGDVVHRLKFHRHRSTFLALSGPGPKRSCGTGASVRPDDAIGRAYGSGSRIKPRHHAAFDHRIGGRSPIGVIGPAALPGARRARDR